MNLLLLDNILAQVPRSEARTKTALDIGCGTGDLAIKLAERGYQVTGIDLSQVAIEQACSRADEHEVSFQVTFLARDIESEAVARQLPSQPFDLITCKLVYAFIKDSAAFLQNVCTLLKPTGIFVLITPVLYSGIEYDKRLQSISVDFGTTQEQLRRYFKSVEVIHTDYFEELGSEVTLIAKDAYAQPNFAKRPRVSQSAVRPMSSEAV